VATYTTKFGSLLDFEKGAVEVIDDDARHYAFSNVFDVAANSKAWERVVVAQNEEYVLETVRAEGTSAWRVAGHDEFALVMSGEVVIDLIKLESPPVAADKKGSVQLPAEPEGPRMGRIIASRGHLALLPANAAYRMQADIGSVVLVQTIYGDDSVTRWQDICQTA